jgi:hypothetical protein
MKAKLIILALAIFSSSFLIAQPVNPESNKNCDKKVLRKIKNNMNYLDIREYLAEGSKTIVIITYYINDENELTVAGIKAHDDDLANAIVETLEMRPIKCENQPTGEYFTFRMTLRHMPA